MAHGELIDGVWHTRFHNTKATGGRFQRGQPKYRNWVTADGSAGPSGSGGFPAARGRYHLYVSLACPWAHRTVLFRKLKGLEDVISMSEVEPVMGDEGWQFGPDADDDSVNGKKHLHEIYTMADPRYTGRSSVPILWDKEQRTIVNNESPEIIRMLNSAFDAFTNDRTDYYPAALRGEIDAVNELVFKNVNNGVYRCGFASTQEAYEEAFLDLFGTLDQLEERLSRQRYLCGAQITEADWRLFTTLLRFDAVYVGLLQVQPAPHRGLSEPLELSARSLPGAGRGRDGEHRSHQAALLHEHAAHQSDRHRAARPGAGFRGGA